MALEPLGIGALDGPKNYYDPPLQDYYDVKVKIFHGDLNTNGGYKVKTKPSTFFPDSWSRQKVQQELAYAFQNPQFKYGNMFQGQMTDGVTAVFFIRDNKIVSAFAYIPKPTL